MEELSQVQGDVDLVELGAAGQRRTLPPSLSPVDGIGDGMGAVTVAISMTTDVTVLTLDGLTRVSGHRASDQFAVQVVLGPTGLVLSAGRGGGDLGPLGQVEVGRVETEPVHSGVRQLLDPDRDHSPEQSQQHPGPHHVHLFRVPVRSV